MSRERPRVPMYRCRTAGGPPVRTTPTFNGGGGSKWTIAEPTDVAPFLAWVDKRYAAIVRQANEHPSIRARGSNCTGTHNPATGSEPLTRLVLSVGWDPTNGHRRLTRWRWPKPHDRFGGFAPREVLEAALIHAGLCFEDVYPVGWDAPCAAWLRRTLILHAIAEALDTLVAREWADRQLAKRPPRSSFALLAEKIDAERWDVAV